MRNIVNMSTEELETILRVDAERLDGDPDMNQLLPIMEELARRHREEHPEAKTAAQAYQEFLEHYLDNEAADEAIREECRLYHIAKCIVTGADLEDQEALLAPTTPEQDMAIEAEMRRMAASPRASEKHEFSDEFKAKMRELIEKTKKI